MSHSKHNLALCCPLCLRPCLALSLQRAALHIEKHFFDMFTKPTVRGILSLSTSQCFYTVVLWFVTQMGGLIKGYAPPLLCPSLSLPPPRTPACLFSSLPPLSLLLSSHRSPSSSVTFPSLGPTDGRIDRGSERGSQTKVSQIEEEGEEGSEWKSR